MVNAGLVLEGGGMRGAYTCGALDCFADQGLSFGQIYGVSAGSCHACSFLSGQRGRAAATVIDYAGDKRYGSMDSFWKTGDYFNVEFVYNQVPNRLLPFDYETFRGSGMSLWAVLTDCNTGLPSYRRVADLQRDMDLIRASSSLPLLARAVKIDGTSYLDGGIADSIPLARSIARGNDKNVVVLTQHRYYQKKPNRLLPLIRAKYRRWPRLVEAVKTRHIRYNQALELVYAQELAGRAVVIQPQFPVAIGRLEKDRGKLQELYNQGYQDARDKLQEIARLAGT